MDINERFDFSGLNNEELERKLQEERYVFVEKDENVLKYFMIDTDEIMDYKESVFNE